jgi:hypothetical protein
MNSLRLRFAPVLAVAGAWCGAACSGSAFSSSPASGGNEHTGGASAADSGRSSSAGDGSLGGHGELAADSDRGGDSDLGGDSGLAGDAGLAGDTGLGGKSSPDDCSQSDCATCSDGEQNGAESDVDCGGSCGQSCALARACLMASDCSSGTCFEGHCVPKTVTGEVLNRETWDATASDTYAGTSTDNALDGDPMSVWSSGTPQYPGMWFLVDMREPQVFFGIELMVAPTSVDFGALLRVSSSVDGTTFTELRTDVKGANELKIHFPTARYARYLKLEALETGHWWRIDELTVSR